ncbi:hypothetical protein AB1Y20_002260 [Prymnesium parvum]|uniref:AAA+ ATPase domain-containing protein n=1 Tax=Prymnesium parvum TaxID=97485 RepID=A0AB34JB88_PRYPA
MLGALPLILVSVSPDPRALQAPHAPPIPPLLRPRHGHVLKAPHSPPSCPPVPSPRPPGNPLRIHHTPGAAPIVRLDSSEVHSFRNVALHKPCLQSSTPDSGSCTLALNNDTRTFAHTASEDQPWFLVDLRAPHYIDSVRLWNRIGAEQHLRDFYLAVANDSSSVWPVRGRQGAMARGESLVQSEDATVIHVEGRFERRVQVQLNTVGRYVIVRRRHSGPLDISELEVFGSQISFDPDPQDVPFDGSRSLLDPSHNGLVASTTEPTAFDLIPTGLTPIAQACDPHPHTCRLAACDDGCRSRLMIAVAVVATIGSFFLCACEGRWRATRKQRQWGFRKGPCFAFSSCPAYLPLRQQPLPHKQPQEAAQLAAGDEAVVLCAPSDCEARLAEAKSNDTPHATTASDGGCMPPTPVVSSSSSGSGVSRSMSWFGLFRGSSWLPLDDSPDASDPALVTSELSSLTADPQAAVADRLAPACPSLLVLFSVPLVVEDAQNGFRPLEPIDIEAEAALLRRSLRESGRAVSVAFEVATADNFRSLLTLGAFSCLHFSGHGHPNAIAFEDNCGAAHFVDLQQLRRLMAAGDGQAPLQLVFVNCCYSAVAAHNFVECGIRHVIASPLQLRDVAAASFTRGLYMALGVGKTVADAFAIARECVRACPRLSAHEANRLADTGFVLLPADSPHDSSIWPLHPERSPSRECLAPPPAPLARLGRSELPFPPEDFVGRTVDMYRALHSLRRRRLVLLVGRHGAGKTALATALVRHQAVRRVYSDGVAYIACGPGAAAEADSRCHSMCTHLCNELNVPAASSPTEALVSTLRDKECVLVIDGVGSLCAAPAFAELLRQLLSRTLHLRILLTSDALLPPTLSLPAKIVTFHLPPLAPVDGARLFARRIGRPIAELLPAGAHPTLDTLAEQPLLRHLAGHPEDIVRCAASVSERLTLQGARGALESLTAELRIRNESAAKPDE